VILIAASPLKDPFPLETGSSVEAAPSFERVYAEEFDFVWRCLQGLGVPRALLEDAAQDVFVIVHRRLPSYEGRSSLRTWLYGVVRNVAYKQRRRAKRKPTETLEEEPESPELGPEERAQDEQAARFVRRFASSLDDRKREIFVACLLEQLSVPEVAEALGIPLNTAYTRLRAARLEFQRALASLEEKS
jgi:RNA polymerase sigma-70 factor (ECF subfamily)